MGDVLWQDLCKRTPASPGQGTVLCSALEAARCSRFWHLLLTAVDILSSWGALGSSSNEEQSELPSMKHTEYILWDLGPKPVHGNGGCSAPCRIRSMVCISDQCFLLENAADILSYWSLGWRRGSLHSLVSLILQHDKDQHLVHSVFSNYFYLCIETEKCFLAELSLYGLMHKSEQGIAVDYMVNIFLVVLPSKKCSCSILSVKWN